jgi:2-hydroxychromene-2-carboxylate isomerase
MSSPIDFWFSIGSTYTYLSVMRIEAVARQSGVTFRWRPFDVSAIMIEMDNIPFSNKKPAKARYMWRDIERRAILHRLPWVRYPALSD